MGHAQLEVVHELPAGQRALLVRAAFLKEVHDIGCPGIQAAQAGLQNGVRTFAVAEGQDDAGVEVAAVQLVGDERAGAEYARG